MIPDWNLLEWFGAVFLAICAGMAVLVSYYWAELLWNRVQDAREARREFNAAREWERYEADEALHEFKERGL